MTGEAAIAHLQAQQDLLLDAAQSLKTAPGDLADRIASLVAERKRLEKELADAKKKAAMGGGASSGPAVKDLDGVKFLGQVLEGVSPKDLRGMADEAKKTIGSGVVALIAVNEGKAGLLVARTDDLADRISAVELVRTGASALGGKGGGGRPDMAQAGGPDGANASMALAAIEGALMGE